jgi:hypothetical protein
MGEIEIKTPQEAQRDELLQVIAVLIERLGGEVVIGQEEFACFDGVQVLGRNLSSGYVRFRLSEDDEESVVEVPEHIPVE